MELSLSRMTDKLIHMEYQNKEGKYLIMQMEEQISTLLMENRLLREKAMEEKVEALMTVEEELKEKYNWNVFS